MAAWKISPPGGCKSTAFLVNVLKFTAEKSYFFFWADNSSVILEYLPPSPESLFPEYTDNQSLLTLRAPPPFTWKLDHSQNTKTL